MGLIIDYLDQEKERLKHIVAESQRIKTCVAQFIENTSQLKENFLGRQSSLNAAIYNCEKKAISRHRRTEFKRNISGIKKALSDITEKLNITIDEYYSQIRTCATYDKCEETKQSFFRKYNEILESFEEIVLDVEEISHEYDMDDNFISVRDAILSDITIQNSSISELSLKTMMKIEKEISDYRDHVNPETNSDILKTFINMRQSISDYKEEAEKYTVEVSSDVSSLNSKSELQHIRIQMEAKYKTLKQKIIEIEEQLGRKL